MVESGIKICISYKKKSHQLISINYETNKYNKNIAKKLQLQKGNDGSKTMGWKIYHGKNNQCNINETMVKMNQSTLLKSWECDQFKLIETIV